MRVAVIDVGSNTARLLVANVTPTGRSCRSTEEREYLRLGAEIERTGTLGAKKIAAAAETCARLCAPGAPRSASSALDGDRDRARAPGRPAAALTGALAEATALPVRVLTADDEGRLAYDGAVARRRATCPSRRRRRRRRRLDRDRRRHAAARRRLAPLRRPRLAPADARAPAPTIRRRAAQIARRRSGRRRRASAEMRPPAPDLALAVGGSARALAKIVGRRFDADDLDRGRRAPRPPPGREGGAPFGIDAERAETLLAGALLLAGHEPRPRDGRSSSGAAASRGRSPRARGARVAERAPPELDRRPPQDCQDSHSAA